MHLNKSGCSFHLATFWFLLSIICSGSYLMTICFSYNKIINALNNLFSLAIYNFSTYLWHVFFFFGRNSPQLAMASSFTRLLVHTQRRTTVGRTPLDEWWARRRDFYLTTHNTHNRQTSMPPGGIRIHNLSRRAAADLRLRPCGHWERHLWHVTW